MAILAGDIKLVASQVMDDVSEGGGAPTPNVIQDGTSNSIFNDISELDRAGGRVNMRKVFASIQTANTDTYLGGNVIVADPPDDPNVSVTIFKTNDVFDQRSDARNRIESYLNKGSLWPGFLLENHVAGQRSIQIFHRDGVAPPVVGKTLYLVANEGLESEYYQYVRVTAVTTELRTFSYTTGSGIVDYQARVSTCSLSDALTHDFQGSEPSRLYETEPGTAALRDTVVADAATYYGATATTAAIAIGDISADVESIFTKLVPSAQTETALIDKSLTGTKQPMVATAAASVTRSVTRSLAPNAKHFLPTGCLPGSLNFVAGAYTFTDNAVGDVLSGAVVVGTIDYATGEIDFNGDFPFSGSGTYTESYIPAAPVTMQSHTTNRPVTAESRAYVWVFPLTPIPAPGSAVVSYMAQGNWYDLQDNGNGVISGTDSAFGVGTVSYTTGTLTVTLGALPDVGSEVLVSWGTKQEYVALTEASLGVQQPRINFDAGSAVSPGTFLLSWTTGGVSKTAVDNGSGVITGDATGVIFYGSGTGYVTMSVLPDANAIGMDFDTGDREVYGTTVSEGVSWSGTLPNAPIEPKSLTISLQLALKWSTDGIDRTIVTPGIVRDNGSGGLVLDGYGALAGSSINYTTGAVVVPINFSVSTPVPQYTNVPAYTLSSSMG